MSKSSAWSEAGLQASPRLWDSYPMGTDYRTIKWKRFSSVPYRIWRLDNDSIVCEPYNKPDDTDSSFWSFDRWGLIAEAARDAISDLIDTANFLPIRPYVAVYGPPRMMKLTRIRLGGD